MPTWTPKSNQQNTTMLEPADGWLTQPRQPSQDNWGQKFEKQGAHGTTRGGVGEFLLWETLSKFSIQKNPLQIHSVGFAA